MHTCCTEEQCPCRHGHRHGSLAKLFIRIAIGLIMIVNGYGKLFGMDPGMTMFTGMVANLCVPVPVFFAYLAACIEFFGGLLVLIGYKARWAAGLIACEMLVTLTLVRGFHLPAGQADLMIFASAVALALTGPGKLSLDAECHRRREMADV